MISPEVADAESLIFQVATQERILLHVCEVIDGELRRNEHRAYIPLVSTRGRSEAPESWNSCEIRKVAEQVKALYESAGWVVEECRYYEAGDSYLLNPYEWGLYIYFQRRN